MRLTRYAKLEKAIADGDGAGVIERWHWGHVLLRDDERTTPAGNLRHGERDKLIAAAKTAGRKLSEREIQYRLQAARAYPTEAQIRKALADFETWWDLIQARFPTVEAPDGAEPYDPRTGQPKPRPSTGANALPSAHYEQTELFPKHDGDATLADLAAYQREMRDLTARFAARDNERAEYLERLIEAAGGDLTWTLAEAVMAMGDDVDVEGDE